MQSVNAIDASPDNAESKGIKSVILYNGTGYVAINGAFFMTYVEMRKVKSDVERIEGKKSYS